MASATQHRRAILLAAVLLLASSPAAKRAAEAAAGCEGEKFPANRSYAHCSDLPQLGAALHWTYDAKNSLLSVAFVARPPAGANGGGWVSWALNPTGDGMKGAQALVAFKDAAGGGGASSTSASVYVVNTYNVTGYRPLGANSTSIAFRATDLAADESGGGGKVRLYGKLQLPQGMKAVNHIWQVGSAVANGAPAKHAFAKENLDAKGRLVLTGGGALPPAPAPGKAAGGPSGNATAKGATPQSGGKATPAAGAATYVSAPVLVLLAVAGFLATV